MAYEEEERLLQLGGEKAERDARFAAQCLGKERFSGRQEAAKVARRISRKAADRRYRGSRLPSENLNCYKCEHCGGWHIGRWGSKR